MAVVLFVWAFTFICLFGLGWLFLSLFKHPDQADAHDQNPFLICIGGLVLVTAIANCWAYFAPVGALLNVLVLLLAIVILLRDRSAVACYLRHWTSGLQATTWPVKVALAALLFIALVKSASPSELIDEGSYYLPYIRWIEQYHIIPGLGNIEDRLGFNSSFHMASAFFGLSWLVPGGAYDLNGALLLLFGAWCMGALGRLLKRGVIVRMSDVMKLFALFFLMRNMITSSAADLSNMFLAEAVLILFIQKVEARTVSKADATFWLMAAGALFVTTIKLSSALVCLAPAYLAFRILKEHHRFPWTRAIILSALVVLPWLGRFTILTGYAVYPLYQVDLFAVDWKVPKVVAERQYYYVGEFAKTNAQASESKQLAKDRGVVEWVPAWFARENKLNKAMALAMAASLLGLLVIGLFRMRRTWREYPDYLAFGVILFLGVAVWFLKNPAFRFGWSWGITLVAFFLFMVLRSTPARNGLRWATLLLFALSLASSTMKTAMESRDVLAHHVFSPSPLPQVPVTQDRLGSVVVRVSDQLPCWGTAPPCLPRDYDERLEARGSRVEDGFRIGDPH